MCKVPGPRVFSTSGGITLHVNLHGTMELFSGWRAVRAGNILATYLIFFSPEQIEQVESVFSEFGEGKTKGSAFDTRQIGKYASL